MTSEEFKKWLDDPKYKPLSFNDGSAFRVYMRIPKNDQFDYLYESEIRTLKQQLNNK